MRKRRKAYFYHDISIPKRSWFVGCKALESQNRNKRLPLVFLAPIYVPFQKQIVRLTDENRYLKNNKCAKFLFPINWREGGGGFAGGSMENFDKTPDNAIEREVFEELGIKFKVKSEDIVISSIDNNGTVALIYAIITHDLDEFNYWASMWINAEGISKDCEIEGVRRFSIDYEYYPKKKEGIVQGLPKKLWMDGGCLDKYWNNVAREQLLLLLLRLEILTPSELIEIGRCGEYFDRKAILDVKKVLEIIENIEK